MINIRMKFEQVGRRARPHVPRTTRHLLGRRRRRSSSRRRLGQGSAPTPLAGFCLYLAHRRRGGRRRGRGWAPVPYTRAPIPYTRTPVPYTSRLGLLRTRHVPRATHQHGRRVRQANSGRTTGNTHLPGVGGGTCKHLPRAARLRRGRRLGGQTKSGRTTFGLLHRRRRRRVGAEGWAIPRGIAPECEARFWLGTCCAEVGRERSRELSIPIRRSYCIAKFARFTRASTGGRIWGGTGARYACTGIAASR